MDSSHFTRSELAQVILFPKEIDRKVLPLSLIFYIMVGAIFPEIFTLGFKKPLKERKLHGCEIAIKRKTKCTAIV